ncbi:periplasmic heavy metal sensor [Kordiimonas gwangyangensis]|uniref:periplasmic heavy metal sensor n=1 Tax=Kordiimonas gwangyangensis TaxID=288022 RepID=UPI000375BC7A|nr:periplasmic heavy metal sensor [Kordiimonas gwangyangensis]
MAFKVTWVHGLLAASLAANIFVGGYLLGKEIRPDRPHREHRMGGGKELFSMRRLAAYLPEEKREELKELMEGHRNDLRGNFQGIRESEEKVRAILLAETVDKNALRAALTDLEAKTRMLHGPLKAILLDIVADLDLETRQKLAEDMYKRRKWRMKREGFGRDDDDMPPPPPPGGFDDEGPEGGPEEGPGNRF